MDRSPLAYTVYDTSSVHQNYIGEYVSARAHVQSHIFVSYSNIRVNCPFDVHSRWQSASNTPPQYITLRLCRPAIVHGVYFGKGDKPTVCNVRHFKVYGSVHSGWVELADGCVTCAHG